MNAKALLTICLVLLGTMSLQAQTEKQEIEDYIGNCDANNICKYGIKEISTDKELTSLKYDGATVFSADGLAAVKLNGKWGYVNTKGDVIIPFQYDNIVMAFSFGEAKVTLNGRTFYIDKTGKEVQ